MGYQKILSMITGVYFWNDKLHSFHIVPLVDMPNSGSSKLQRLVNYKERNQKIATFYTQKKYEPIKITI